MVATLHPGELTLQHCRDILLRHQPLILTDAATTAIQQGSATIEQAIDNGDVVYGVNTGFGKLAETAIADTDLERLQVNILLSHATGVGALLSDDIVRLILCLKINSLARGYSGVSQALVDMLLAFYNHEVYPCIPSKGSVGASGDLAPLAHLGCALIGVGDVHHQQQRISAEAALAQLQLTQHALQPKEGLAVVNGLQVSTAIAVKALQLCENIFSAAISAGAMTVDAAAGSMVPFADVIQQIRGHQAQIDCAQRFRECLADSGIQAHFKGQRRIQDPYSLRCQPQVMGACLQQIRNVSDILAIEINAVTDNPLVFSDSGDVLSGGNFHGEMIAMACDNLALAFAEIGNLSERRIAFLIDPDMSGLPPFLVADSGLNSGFMLAHVTAAALASENKLLAHPASVDSIPTSANQEDHVSMATHAANRLLTMAENTAAIIAIESLAACQAIEFHAPLTTSPSLQAITDTIRQHVPRWDHDRYFASDIELVKTLVLDGILG